MGKKPCLPQTEKKSVKLLSEENSVIQKTICEKRPSAYINTSKKPNNVFWWILGTFLHVIDTRVLFCYSFFFIDFSKQVGVLKPKKRQKNSNFCH